MFDSLSNFGITKRAFDREICSLKKINPRDFTFDSYKKVDDKSFGGGPGMTMKVEPLDLAMEKALADQKKSGVVKPLRVYMSPQGKVVDQELINRLALEQGIIFVCGRYEGVDERFLKIGIDLELSVGDFVVSGGELPAMLVIDSVIRQMPGVMSDEQSAVCDSFMNGLLDYPHYTHPREYKGMKVPEVLLNGNHKQIELWRLQMSLWRTKNRRPDLLEKRSITKLESRLLEEVGTRLKEEEK